MSRLDVNSLKELLPTEESFPRWIDFCEFEKMEWVNKLLRKMWPVLDEAAGKLVKEQVQPILDQYPLGVIDRIILKTVQFGKRAPEILGRFFCVNYFQLIPFFGFFTIKFL
jgi:Ca2+-dependent lipid-binding protein